MNNHWIDITGPNAHFHGVPVKLRAYGKYHQYDRRTRVEIIGNIGGRYVEIYLDPLAISAMMRVRPEFAWKYVLDEIAAGLRRARRRLWDGL